MGPLALIAPWMLLFFAVVLSAPWRQFSAWLAREKDTRS
jgi:hypothetical protein